MERARTYRGGCGSNATLKRVVAENGSIRLPINQADSAPYPTRHGAILDGLQLLHEVHEVAHHVHLGLLGQLSLAPQYRVVEQQLDAAEQDPNAGNSRVPRNANEKNGKRKNVAGYFRGAFAARGRKNSDVSKTISARPIPRQPRSGLDALRDRDQDQRTIASVRRHRERIGLSKRLKSSV